MADVYFIQYYGKNPWYKNDIPKVHFRNGFSTAYKNLKDKGNFIWLSEDEEIPINKGKLYISVWYTEIIPSIIKKAIQNPELEIHVGGPAFNNYDLNTKNIKNLYSHSSTNIEELFMLDYDKKAWGLEVPKGFKNIGYNVSLQTGIGCSWGKCIYCKCQVNAKNYKLLPRTNIPIIEYDGDKYIWINTSCATPKNFKDIYLDLPDRNDVYYGTYIRGDRQTISSLQENLPLMKVNTQHLKFSIGIEVPCNRILKYLNKGTNTKTYKDILLLLYSYKCNIHISMILGFNNFTWDDVKEIEDFFEKMKTKIDLSNVDITLYKLMILEDRPIYQNPPGLIEKWNNWKSYCKISQMYKCILNDEQKEINNHLRLYYNSLGFKKINDCYDKNTAGRKNIKR